jgi:hypothetical protein
MPNQKMPNLLQVACVLKDGYGQQARDCSKHPAQ